MKVGRINGGPAVISDHDESDRERQANDFYRSAAYAVCAIRGVNPEQELQVPAPSRIQGVQNIKTTMLWKTLIPEIMRCDHVFMALAMTQADRITVAKQEGTEVVQ